MVGGERTRVVAVRLTPAEHEAWLAAAKRAGRSRLGTWVREQVTASLAAAEGEPAAVPAADGVVGLRGELVRVGNNLNQAVRLAHLERTAAGAGGVGLWGAVGAAAAVDLAVGELRVVLRAVHDLAAATGGRGGGQRTPRRPAGGAAAPGPARGAGAGGGR